MQVWALHAKRRTWIYVIILLAAFAVGVVIGFLHYRATVLPRERTIRILLRAACVVGSFDPDDTFTVKITDIAGQTLAVTTLTAPAYTDEVMVTTTVSKLLVRVYGPTEKYYLYSEWWSRVLADTPWIAETSTTSDYIEVTFEFYRIANVMRAQVVNASPATLATVAFYLAVTEGAWVNATLDVTVPEGVTVKSITANVSITGVVVFEEATTIEVLVTVTGDFTSLPVPITLKISALRFEYEVTAYVC